MRFPLVLHPDGVCEAVTSVEVDVVRSADVLGLRYVVAGRIGDLALPPPGRSRRVDGLWEHSCFEAFLGEEAKGEAYTELNVAPSTEWAGYRFASYRAGRVEAALPQPRIEVEAGADRLELRVALKLKDGGRRPLGLSAVIEEAGGRKSYWALAHPPGPPDFHHRDCFAAELPPLGEA